MIFALIHSGTLATLAHHMLCSDVPAFVQTLERAKEAIQQSQQAHERFAEVIEQLRLQEPEQLILSPLDCDEGDNTEPIARTDNSPLLNVAMLLAKKYDPGSTLAGA